MGIDHTVNIPSKGIYFGYAVGVAVPERVEIGVSFDKLQKLDARLLPDELGDIVNNYVGAYLEEALGGEY
jgi:hypothetical protein